MFKKLKENKKQGKKTYVEKQLNEYLKQFTGKSFKKNKYDTEFFIKRTDVEEERKIKFNNKVR